MPSGCVLTMIMIVQTYYDNNSIDFTMIILVVVITFSCVTIMILLLLFILLSGLMFAVYFTKMDFVET